ncbi:UNVERIFIED_CONTAM: Retrovirus-related Pol polyprotein from transposon [Sesamum indicum]
MKNDKPRELKYQPKYHNFTPLTVSREKALMTRTRYGRVQLKDEIGRLVRQEYFRDRVPSGCKVGKDEVRRSRSRSQDRNPGDLQRTRKRCARILGSSREREFVLKVEEEEAVSFDSSDRPVESGVMKDPMVIKFDTANFTVHKVLVDRGSSVDIISRSVIDKIGLENAHLESEARKCYNLSVKGECGQKKRKVEENPEPRPYEADYLKPNEEHKVVHIVEGDPKKNEIIEQEVAKLLKAGYTFEIQYTEWLSNVVLVPKASGKWRMCMDFIDLNKACPKDPCPLSRIDVMVDSTAGFEMFSIMDAYQGYHQIYMAKEDRERTSFITNGSI